MGSGSWRLHNHPAHKSAKEPAIDQMTGSALAQRTYPRWLGWAGIVAPLIIILGFVSFLTTALLGSAGGTIASGVVLILGMTLYLIAVNRMRFFLDEG